MIASNRNIAEIIKTGVIKYCSLLNYSRYFHYAENFFLDSMYDFSEEIISFTITNVNRAFALISPEFGIDACLLNNRIEKFQNIVL